MLLATVHLSKIQLLQDSRSFVTSSQITQPNVNGRNVLEDINRDNTKKQGPKWQFIIVEENTLQTTGNAYVTIT